MVSAEVFIQNYDILQEAYEKLGDYKKSLFYLKKAKDKKEETYGLDSMRNLSEIQSQTELANKEFDASVGGGAVYVKVSGSKEIKEIKIQKEAVDPEDVEMLQDLILSCVNEALRKVDSAQAQELGKYNIPGLM